MKVGMSGHQNIQPQSSVGWIVRFLQEELRDQQATVGVSSLAIGADQIFAGVVLEMGLDLEIVIPCAGYESTFRNVKTRDRFKDMVERAKIRHFLDYEKPSEEAFFAAGKRIVDTVGLMMFVWDGKPARGLGGTADIVQYTRGKRVPFIHLNPTDLSIHSQLST